MAARKRFGEFIASVKYPPPDTTVVCGTFLHLAAKLHCRRESADQ